MWKVNKISDWLLICLLVFLSIGVVAYGVGYVPKPGSVPFWAVTVFVWSIRTIGLVLPIGCGGYAAFLLWRNCKAAIPFATWSNVPDWW
jgi:hypothetical protein